jgi:ppGpp synthetase/RelA/SpoT-type nucleotidyltranferase
MSSSKPTKAHRELIDDLVAHYIANKDTASTLLEILRVHITGDKALKPYIHSIKSRVKDPEHLKDKLERKLLDCLRLGKVFNIDKDNLFVKINDLAGFRILHLHTREMKGIHEALLQLFERERYVLREKPFARTWDDESRSYFKEIGITTKSSPSLYTSVHYVINANSQAKATCEIQVRTLMEEVWGEVDHVMNYPHKIDSVACVEQIKALARVTSSATGLVDSIFRSYEDHLRMTRARALSLRKSGRGQS